MKSNLYYLGILAVSLLLSSGPASFATNTTTTDPSQLTETMEQTEEEAYPEGSVTVSIGEGSNETVQYYTYSPQSVEINAGESVTWFSSAEFADIHTVTFLQDPNIVSDIILPFAAPAAGGGALANLELVPPFNLGEPLIIQAPDGTEAIVALNKLAWYPAVLDANNQTTYLEGTDIQARLNSTVKALNSGIILYVSFALLEAPPMSPTDGAQPSGTEIGTAAGEPEIASESSSSLINETDATTIITNATGTTTTTDVLTLPGVRGTFQPTEGGTVEELYFSGFGPPFPVVSSFTVTFEEPGTYPYFCAIHPWMIGQVVVR